MTANQIGASVATLLILGGAALVVWIVVGLLFVRDRPPRPPRGPGRGEDDIPPDVNPHAGEHVSLDVRPLPVAVDASPVEPDAVSRYDHQEYLRSLAEAQRRRDHDPIEVEMPKDLPIEINTHEWPWVEVDAHGRDN